MTTALLLIFLAGVAEFFKDLSEEGKLTGYWDKNHPPMFRLFGPIDGLFDWRWVEAWPGSNAQELWWRVHWLQGPGWKLLPIWIRQYLAFRDGWHLLKFFSVNLWALAFGLILHQCATCTVFTLPVPCWLFGYVVVRTLFSIPETVGRIIYNKRK